MAGALKTHSDKQEIAPQQNQERNEFFIVPRKGLGEVAVDTLLNTNLQSQEKVAPSTLGFPWGCHHSVLVPSLPSWAATFILLPGPFHCRFLGKEWNTCQRVPVINAILIKIP